MKKSTRINLALITMAFASCKTVMVQPPADNAFDSSLIITPGSEDSTYIIYPDCSCYDYYLPQNYAYNAYGNYYTGIITENYYYTRNRFASKTVRNGKSFIARGGFGSQGSSGG